MGHFIKIINDYRVIHHGLSETRLNRGEREVATIMSPTMEKSNHWFHWVNVLFHLPVSMLYIVCNSTIIYMELQQQPTLHPHG